MTKRVVVRVAARGYVDGRYIGEEKEVIEAVDPSGRGKKHRGKSSGKNDGTGNDNRGNRVASGRGGKRNDGRSGLRSGVAKEGGGRNPRRPSSGTPGGGRDGNVLPGPAGAKPPRTPREPAGRNRRGGRSGVPREVAAAGGPVGDGLGNANPRAGRVRGSKKTPFRTSSASAVSGKAAIGNGQRALISEVAETRRWGDESKSGQFADALAKEETVKRERLHKVLAQSGHGSRRDMEIMITSGRVMVNGIVATIGTSVSASDAVMVDRQLVKLKFDEALPRVLLYHKPEGEIVTTSDPGNRITVFDNLPRVETGKWMSIGRLDINTSGLLIFTTNGELANRLMHPRYEVEREYAVRVLGELTDEQTQRLLDGVSIMPESADEDDDEAAADDRPAKFESIEKRGGEGANQWYHIVIREGRNREVRKMFESIGLTVSRLIRVRFGKIGLPPRLTRGRMVELDASQVRAVLKWVGMEVEGHIGTLPTNNQPNRGQRRGNESPVGGLEEAGESRGRADGQGRGRRGRGRDREQDRPVEGAAPDFVAGEGAVREFQASHVSQENNSGRDDAGPSVPRESDNTVPVNAAREPQHERGVRGRGRHSRRSRGPRDGSQMSGGPGRDNARLAGTPANAADNNDNIGNQMRNQAADAHPEYESPEDSIGNRITLVGGDTGQRPKPGSGRNRQGSSGGGRSSSQGLPRGGAGAATNTGGRSQANAGGGRRHSRGRRKPGTDSDNSGNR